MTNEILEIVDLQYKSNRHGILNDVSIKFHPNRIYGIIGLNGSGKTSFANCMMGLGEYRNVRGDILFEGKSIKELDITERAKLGIHLSWQEPARFQGISIRKYLEISMKEKIEDDEERNLVVNNVLKKVGMKPRRYGKRMLDKSLSGGERKRLELASLILLKPKIALLDEPDSGIDIDSISYITSCIRELRNQNSAVILITHNKSLLKICEEVYMMKRGVLVKAKRMYGIEEEEDEGEDDILEFSKSSGRKIIPLVLFGASASVLAYYLYQKYKK